MSVGLLPCYITFSTKLLSLKLSFSKRYHCPYVMWPISLSSLCHMTHIAVILMSYDPYRCRPLSYDPYLCRPYVIWPISLSSLCRMTHIAVVLMSYDPYRCCPYVIWPILLSSSCHSFNTHVGFHWVTYGLCSKQADRKWPFVWVR